MKTNKPLKKLASVFLFFGLISQSFSKCPETDPAREGYLKYSFNESLFTTFAFINYGKYLGNDSAGLNPLALSLCRDLKKNLSEESCNEIADTYRKIKTHHDWMLGYVATVVALHCSAPPAIKPYTRQIEYFDSTHATSNKWILGNLAYWDTIFPKISEFWHDSGINALIAKYKPVYDSAGYAYLRQADPVIDRSLDYLKMPPDILEQKNIKLVLNLIGPDGEMGPQFCDTIYDIKGFNNTTDYRPHEMLHSLIMSLTKNPQYEDQIRRIVVRVWPSVCETPGAKSYSDPIIYFDECLVRTLDNIILESNSLHRHERMEQIIEHESKKGFALVKPMWKALQKYEAESATFSDYFEALLGEMETNLTM